MKKLPLDFDENRPVDILYTIFNGINATVAIESNNKKRCELIFRSVDLFLVENESIFFINNTNIPIVSESILWECDIEDHPSIPPEFKKYLVIAGDYCITIYASDVKELIF